MTNSTTGIAREAATTADRRGRRGWKLLWLLVGGLVLFVLLVPAVGYWMWMNRGRAMLRSEIAAIAARGEPLTTEELKVWQEAKQSGGPDITKLWMAALESFDHSSTEDMSFKQSLGNGISQGNYRSGPWAQEKEANEYLKRHQARMANLDAAANEIGFVRFPDKAAADKALLQIQRALGDIDLRLTSHLRAHDYDRAIGDITTALTVVDRIEDDVRLRKTNAPQREAPPICVTLTLRQNWYFKLHSLGQQFPLNNAQLVRLQELVRMPFNMEDLRDALITMRSDCLHPPIQRDIRVNPRATTIVNDPTLNLETFAANAARPEELAHMLKLLSDALAATDSPLATALADIDALAHDTIQVSNEDPIALVPFSNHQQLRDQALGILNVTFNVGRAEALRELINVVLATKRYQLKHEMLPASLDKLVPEFLPAVPIDPFGGGSIRSHFDGSVLKVWSINLNRIDDQGENDRNSAEKDMTLRIPLQKSRLPNMD